MVRSYFRTSSIVILSGAQRAERRILCGMRSFGLAWLGLRMALRSPVRLIRIAAIGTVLCAVGSYANAQVFLEEGKVQLDVAPGENIAGKLTLHNTSDQDVDMKVYWEDFVYKPPFDGSKEFSPKGTSDYSIADWVNVSTQSLIFGPYAKRTVSYSVNVPEDMDKGHYGVLFFEKEGMQVDGKTGLNVVTRVGCLFFIEPKNKVVKADIKNIQLSEQGLTSRFTNQGNVVLIPSGTFYVINEEGMALDRGEMDKIYLPPDQIADYALAFNRDLDPGVYTLVMTVTFEGGEVLVKEIDFQKSYPSAFNIIEIRD